MRPRTIALTFALCLLVALTPSNLCADAPHDAIVRIVAERNAGPPSVGTGTVISADGHILTCYHVIRDAKEISISFAGRRLDLPAKVISISPDYDLAMLQLGGPIVGDTFLPPSDQDPSAFSQSSTAYGYPANYAYSLHKIAVDAMDPSYTLSGDARTDDGKGRLFTRYDIKLVTFTSVVNNGASGSPILFNGRVVGVISGSWSRDGSGAWAIPVMYLSSLVPLKPDMSVPGHWPAVNLLGNNAELGRSSVNLSAKVIIALGTFSRSLVQLKDTCSPLVQLAPQISEMLQDRLAKADAAVQKYGAQTRASDHPGEQGISMDWELLLRLGEIAPCTQAFNDVYSDGSDLTAEVSTYSYDLERLPKNEQPRDPTLLKETNGHVTKLTDIVNALNNADRDFIYREPDTATIGDYQAAFRQDVQFMKDKDSAGLYVRTVAELDAYYDVVNRLVESK